MAQGQVSGSCGHYHACFDDAARCVQGDGSGDRVVVEVKDASSIHESATLGTGARWGREFAIGAFAVLGERVVLGDACAVAEHAVVRADTIVGSRTRIDSFAVIGGNPQDLSFDPRTSSRVTIGSNVVVREGVTVHRATVPGAATEIHDGVYLMANAHVAHDCIVETNTVIANSVLLAGHVHIGSHVVLGGGAGVHQFVRIGEGAMIGGNATITRDVPPFTTAAGRNGLIGINLVGLRRRGVRGKGLSDLRHCYRAVFCGGDPKTNAAEALASDSLGQSAIGRRFLEFFTDSRRGFARPRGGRAGSRTED